MTLAALRIAFPSAEPRAAASYALVLTVGYGHLLGGLVGGGRAFAASLPGALGSAAGLLGIAASIPLLFQGYAVLLAAWPALLWPVLAVSVWHICENECALTRGHCRLRPVRGPERRLCTEVALTAGVLLFSAAALPLEERALLGPFAAGLPNLGAQGIHFADVFTAITLFHLLSWLEVSAPRRPGFVASIHVIAAFVCGAALTIPGELAARAREVLFSPGLYLFWSALHVVQTTLGRRGASRG